MKQHICYFRDAVKVRIYRSRALISENLSVTSFASLAFDSTFEKPAEVEMGWGDGAAKGVSVRFYITNA